jgi:hypothetical protein
MTENPYEPPRSTKLGRSFWLMLPLRIVAAPLMLLVYILTIVPLTATYAMDCLFDCIGWCVGWDTSHWPFPKAGDEDFRLRYRKCGKCGHVVDSYPMGDE